MNIQDIFSDVRSRVETAGKHYQDAFKAYVDAQRKAFGVVSKNGQTLANTEIGAAKNVYAAAKASFDKARSDGVRQVARNPQGYVPNGRDQIVSAYKDTIDLLVRTGNELGDVLSSGYQSVVSKLSGDAGNTSKSSTQTKTASASTTKTKSGSAKSAGTAKKTSTTTKRKTASSRSTKSAASTATKSNSKSASTTASASKSGDTGAAS